MVPSLNDDPRLIVLHFLGEKLERDEVDVLIKECCDAEDDDGFIPYERK